MSFMSDALAKRYDVAAARQPAANDWTMGALAIQQRRSMEFEARNPALYPGPICCSLRIMLKDVRLSTDGFGHSNETAFAAALGKLTALMRGSE